MNADLTPRPTTFLEFAGLDEVCSCRVRLACEIFQETGSFKFRAASRVAAGVAQRRILAASSGNFGAALARACQLLGKECTVVMPLSSSRTKIEAVRRYGASVDLIDTSRISRTGRVEQLAREDPGAYVASAYDDPLVIEGNASLGREIAAEAKFDAIISPVGGGGLLSGIITGARQGGYTGRFFGAEPLLANDAAQSLRAGQIVCNEGEQPTIADGARTVSVGRHNWPILRDNLSGIVEIPEEKIVEAVRVLYARANLKVEPTGALSVAALLTSPELFRGQSVCGVVSGGNMDADVYARLLTAS